MSSGLTLDSGNLGGQLYDYVSNTISSPITLFVICILLAITYGLGLKTETPSSASMLEIIIWSVFTLLVIANGFLYFFGMEITTYFDKFLQGKTTIGVDVKDKGLRDQVFHIRDNKYAYPDAQAICKAYGARLATYNELEEAYKRGAEWCSYGWSDAQLALFPTQYDTWVKKQNSDDNCFNDSGNDCGRPGINGGYIANPAVRFGVNCFGSKPRITEDEKEKLEDGDYESTNRRDQLIDKRADYWNDHLDDLNVSPFNTNKWNEYNRS
uniref:Link domain-containing protein n=1 Tax=viral metagenome TaxID=1070528 RepID=A0A6C0AXU4_9ZZZZ|tara:strand:- start:1868 stop:2671 length:804 start_codon:yes stop_codon:yes gene_type:complete